MTQKEALRGKTLLHTDCSVLGVTAVGPHHNIELTGFEDILQVGIVEPQHVGSYLEANILTLASSKMDATECLQLLHRTGDACHLVADVELHNLVAARLPVLVTRTVAVWSALICSGPYSKVV